MNYLAFEVGYSKFGTFEDLLESLDLVLERIRL